MSSASDSLPTSSPLADPQTAPSSPGHLVTSVSATQPWWLPDGYADWMADWRLEQWQHLLGFETTDDLIWFAQQALRILGRGDKLMMTTDQAHVQQAMMSPYARHVLFGMQPPGQAKPWTERCFDLYDAQFSPTTLRVNERIKLPEALESTIGWQLVPALRRLVAGAEQSARVLRHWLGQIDAIEQAPQSAKDVWAACGLALSDVFCAPELFQYLFSKNENFKPVFPQISAKIETHAQAYRKDMPVSLQALLGVSQILSDVFSDPLRRFAVTGENPEVCFDQFRDIKSLVDVTVQLTEHALPALVERTLDEIVNSPAKMVAAKGPSASVQTALAHLLRASRTVLRQVEAGKLFGELRETPWAHWATRVIEQMTVVQNDRAALEDTIKRMAKDPIQNLHALRDLAIQMDAFEDREPCQALRALLDQEPRLEPLDIVATTPNGERQPKTDAPPEKDSQKGRQTTAASEDRGRRNKHGGPRDDRHQDGRRQDVRRQQPPADQVPGTIDLSKPNNRPEHPAESHAGDANRTGAPPSPSDLPTVRVPLNSAQPSLAASPTLSASPTPDAPIAESPAGKSPKAGPPKEQENPLARPAPAQPTPSTAVSPQSGSAQTADPTAGAPPTRTAQRPPAADRPASSGAPENDAGDRRPLPRRTDAPSTTRQ